MSCRSHNDLNASKVKGFTLIELLVVMAIIGVLVTLIAAGFRSAQFRGRDAKRKSDLRGLGNSLETFLSDYKTYPAESGGQISGCPYDPASGTGTACTWGTGELTDGKTTYFKVIPADPDSGQKYVYRIVPGSSNQKFQLFARLENTQDKDCLGGDCNNPPASLPLCGSKLCNFGITSPNTKPTD